MSQSDFPARFGSDAPIPPEPGYSAPAAARLPWSAGYESSSPSESSAHPNSAAIPQTRAHPPTYGSADQPQFAEPLPAFTPVRPRPQAPGADEFAFGSYAGPSGPGHQLPPRSWAGPDPLWPAQTSGPVSSKPRRAKYWLVAPILALFMAILVAFIPDSTQQSYRITPGHQPRISRTDADTTTSYAVEITDQMRAGTALIQGTISDGLSWGTGIVLDKSGLVLTNYHVVAGTESLLVKTASDDQLYSAQLLGRNVWEDIAVLKLDNIKSIIPAKLADTPAAIGDSVIAVGNAGAPGSLVASGGTVVNADANVSLASSPFGGFGNLELSDMITSSAAAVPGYSGGPTFNKDTEVVGITSAGTMNPDTKKYTYSIPIASALSIAKDIIDGKQSSHTRIGPKGWLGVKLSPNNVPLITSVEQGSPADMVGIVPGSVITSFDGSRITTARELLEELESHDPGESVAITWSDTDNPDHEATVTLGTNKIN